MNWKLKTTTQKKPKKGKMSTENNQPGKQNYISLEIAGDTRKPYSQTR